MIPNWYGQINLAVSKNTKCATSRRSTMRCRASIISLRKPEVRQELRFR